VPSRREGVIIAQGETLGMHSNLNPTPWRGGPNYADRLEDSLMHNKTLMGSFNLLSGNDITSLLQLG
jgi:hypothetical protein